MEDLSLHILDIVENSLRAKATSVVIRLTENPTSDTLVLEIIDDGEGMDEEAVHSSLDPFYTTKSGKKVGLGLPFLAQSAEEAGGSMRVESAIGEGTRIMATFTRSHIDRKPLGNLEETLRTLKATHPEVRFSFEHLMTDG
jgi:signal transduction histidine kinase